MPIPIWRLKLVTKAAREAGDEIRIEIQGAMGIENRLTQEDINDADMILFAVNIGVRDTDRFSEKKNRSLLIQGNLSPMVKKHWIKLRKSQHLWRKFLITRNEKERR